MIREARIRIPFRYAAGAIGSRFLAALRDEGRIMGSRCQACDIVACPARPFCPTCAMKLDALVEVGPSGTLVSFTEAPGGIFALVRLDGATTAMLHRLLGGGPWRMGCRVRGRLSEKRVGSILDIEGFEAVEEGGAS